MNDPLSGRFLRQVESLSGQPVSSCYQCRKCSAGCPVAGHMDFAPHQLHRLIQSGSRGEALASRSIWLCVGCGTCGARCPNGIATSKVADALKQTAVREKVRSREKAVQAMHRAFLAGVAKRGRMHELTLIRDMRLRSGGLFKDLKLGWRMLRLGKLRLKAEKVKELGDLRKIFEGARRSP